MKNRLLRIIIMPLIVLAVAYYLHEQDKNKPHNPTTYNFTTMGTIATFSTLDPNGEAEYKIVRDTFFEISDKLSAFSPKSDLSKLAQNGQITLPQTDHLPIVLKYALQISNDSQGAFTPAINPLMRLWGFREKAITTIPTPQEIATAIQYSNPTNITITTTNNTTHITITPTTELDLGAIAKGYAVDLAYSRLQAIGAQNCLINLGGMIRVMGTPQKGRTTWHITLRDPANSNNTIEPIRDLNPGEAIATSGSYERYREIDGIKYSHIIDPRTGYPVTNNLQSVTIIAPTAMEADASSTVLFLLGQENAKEYLVRHPQITPQFLK